MTIGTIVAQPAPDAARARALLESPDMKDNAWGAYYAGMLHDASLRDVVVEHLRRAIPLGRASDPTVSRTLPKEYVYVVTLFDSLIQIGGPVPLDVILAFDTLPGAPRSSCCLPVRRVGKNRF